MLKRNLITLAISVLLIANTIQWRTQLSKCKPTTPPTPPSPPVVCTDGYVKIGTNLYTKCVDCIPGTDSSLGSKLNNDRIFESEGWIYGGTVGPNIPNQNNLLGLTYNPLTGTYSFTNPNTRRFKIVISLQAGSCYTPYYFPCISCTQLQQVLFNTLGVDNGTEQALMQMTYYYKECEGTTPPVVCSFSNPTSPAKTGIYDCSVYGSVKPLVDGSLIDSEACFGSYRGNLDHGSCPSDREGNVCFYEVLNPTPNSECKWCFIEKIDVNNYANFGNSLAIYRSTNGRSGSFLINSNLNGPFVLTLKAANFYSGYYFPRGNRGAWMTNFNDLSHASLWALCPPGLSNVVGIDIQ